MAEYIEREKALQFHLKAHIGESKFSIAQAVADAIAAYINAVPAADVVPVRHGRWNRDKDGLVWCCLCGFGQERSEDRPYAYCPNCGTLMDKDGDGDV